MERIKSTFQRFFDNLISKYLIFKNFWHALSVLGYLIKSKIGLGLAFGAYLFS